MFTRSIKGTAIKITDGPHKGKVGTVKTHNVPVGMVRVYVDGFGSGSELLHLPTEYVKLLPGVTYPAPKNFVILVPK